MKNLSLIILLVALIIVLVIDVAHSDAYKREAEASLKAQTAISDRIDKLQSDFSGLRTDLWDINKAKAEIPAFKQLMEAESQMFTGFVSWMKSNEEEIDALKPKSKKK
jgi:hypothetical protein